MPNNVAFAVFDGLFSLILLSYLTLSDNQRYLVLRCIFVL